MKVGLVVVLCKLHQAGEAAPSLYNFMPSLKGLYTYTGPFGSALIGVRAFVIYIINIGKSKILFQWL